MSCHFSRILWQIVNTCYSINMSCVISIIIIPIYWNTCKCTLCSLHGAAAVVIFHSVHGSRSCVCFKNAPHVLKLSYSEAKISCDEIKSKHWRRKDSLRMNYVVKLNLQKWSIDFTQLVYQWLDIGEISHRLLLIIFKFLCLSFLPSSYIFTIYASNFPSQEECQPCLPGYYCDAEGLLVPSGQCWEGFFCLEGAERPDPPIRDSRGGPCPEGDQMLWLTFAIEISE